jgi:dTDP-4-amino-4,6-dideoxygalactose transaminase
MKSEIKIPFNRPYSTGNEAAYAADALASGKISGDGAFTKKCHAFFESRYGFKKALLTTSCSDALEMSALLLGLKPGDEVILPSYTFVSTANAFLLRGAKLVFADSYSHEPNMDANAVEKLITDKTRVIVPVHYGGVTCDMDKIMELANAHGIFVVEDAAQALDSYYQTKGGERKAAGTIGHMSAFSFHETKNIVSGEGGMLAINDPRFIGRAEVIREKGTNRSAFFRGEVDKYGWVDVGSSFLPSDIIAAVLYAQLEQIDTIQSARKRAVAKYFDLLAPLREKKQIQLPYFPDYAAPNAHVFYLICTSLDERSALIAHLRSAGIASAFHYQSLHASTFFKEKHDGRVLPNADRYTDCLVRLPLFAGITDEELNTVASTVLSFYGL